MLEVRVAFISYFSHSLARMSLKAEMFDFFSLLLFDGAGGMESDVKNYKNCTVVISPLCFSSSSLIE